MLTALWDAGPLTHFTSQFFGRSLLMTEISAIYNPISLVWVTLLTGRAYTQFSYSPRIRQIYILLVIVWKSLIVKERHTGLFKDKIQIPNITGKLIIVFADTRHLKIIKVALGVCFALKSWKEYLLLFTYLITLGKDVTLPLITKFKTNKPLSNLFVNRIPN